MKSLSVAIIGTGNIAGGYDEKKTDGDAGIYTHAGAYAARDGFELRTVFDVDREVAESFCRRWKAGGISTELGDIYRGFHDVVSLSGGDASFSSEGRPSPHLITICSDGHSS